MKIEFAFESHRRAADDYPRQHGQQTVFVDYGDKNEGLVFDHHACSDGACSASLVCSEDGANRLAPVRSPAQHDARLRIVTHANPDLDSVAAALAVCRFVNGHPHPLSQHLVEYVRRRDQGEVIAEDPLQSLSLLFQAVKNACSTDEEVMRKGIALLGVVDDAISCGSFHLGWNDLASVPELRQSFPEALRELSTSSCLGREYLATAPKVLLSVPEEGDAGEPIHRWADGIILDFAGLDAEPIGWKEMVRSEGRVTMTGRPCPFMIVRSKKRERDNYIISVCPRSQLSLKGFGAYIDGLESERSSQMETTRGSWTQRIMNIAAHRGTPGAECLERTHKPGRHGYRNADPWYDGRGHNFTIVDTPESGTVLEPHDVLTAVLSWYCPWWKEYIQAARASCIVANTSPGASRGPNLWLRRYVPNWSGALGVVRPMSSEPTPAGVSLADAIASVSTMDAKMCPAAIYLPITPASPQTLPRDDQTLHILFALYMMAHRLMPISAIPPRIDTVREWSTAFVASPSPGLWWAVAEDPGLVMIDYMARDKVGNPFARISEQYFSMLTQLVWTKSLSPAIQRQKRQAALAEFVVRNRTS